MKKKRLNLPNTLSLLRVALIPVFVALVFVAVNLGKDIFLIFALAVFIIASATDFLDGYIARKYNLVTDFGKFLDPLADKALTITAFICLMVIEYQGEHKSFVFGCIAVSTMIVIFRELAVTSLRLVASGKKVIAAGWLGKIKTVTQMLFVIAYFAEVLWTDGGLYTTFAAMALMVIMTLWSGVDYFVKYLPLLDPEK